MQTQAFVSIGRNCATGSLLQTARLRTESLAFDWARSTLASVRDVLVRGVDWHLRQIERPGYAVEYVHHSLEDMSYFRSCTLRLFSTVENADELHLVCCTPGPVDIGEVVAVRDAAIAVRDAARCEPESLGARDVSAHVLHGYAGPPYGVRGIVRSERRAPGVFVVDVAADKAFQTNFMRGPFYEQLARDVFPFADKGRIYHSGIQGKGSCGER